MDHQRIEPPGVTWRTTRASRPSGRSPANRAARGDPVDHQRVEALGPMLPVNLLTANLGWPWWTTSASSRPG